MVPWRSEGVTVVGGLWLAAGLSQAARLDPTASSSGHAAGSPASPRRHRQCHAGIVAGGEGAALKGSLSWLRMA